MLLTKSRSKMIKKIVCIILSFIIIEANRRMTLSGGVENTGISLVMISDISMNSF